MAVELAGVTRFIARSQIAYAEAQGDYVRLSTLGGRSHLLRAPLSRLENDWAASGFVRIHRSLLVSLAHVSALHMEAGRCSVLLHTGETSEVELQVARRHVKALRERLRDHAP